MWWVGPGFGSQVEGRRHLGEQSSGDAERLRELTTSVLAVSFCSLLASRSFPRRDELAAWFPCEVGCLLALDARSPFGNKREVGIRKAETVAVVCWRETRLNAFLVWMKTSGRCSRGTTWAGQVGIYHISPDGEKVTNLYY